MSYDLHPVLEVPSMLVLEVAVGIDPLADICKRYGYDDAQIEQLKSDSTFQRQVREQEAELRKDGVTFKLRAAKAAEDLLGVVWREAKTSAVPLNHKLEALKTCAKLADLEPKQNAGPPPGAGFSITINIPGQSAPVQIGASSTQPAPIEHEPLEPLNLPVYKPAASINADLEYRE